jgi:fatty acid desaturase
MSVGNVLKALVEKRERRACWFYALWLAGYCALASITTIYAAALGQDYRWLPVFLLVPAEVGCVQFRFPTLLG